MRGGDVRTAALLSCVSCEGRVPSDHPLRRILPLVDVALADLSGEFAQLYAPIGRPSIPPERLLRALLLQAFYSVRSERQLLEQLDYNLLFRWFTGLGIEDPVWDVTVFTRNRDRLLRGDIAAKFFWAVLSQPEVKALLADEHCTVDGTPIEAWASMKSFKPKDGPDDRRGHGGGRRSHRADRARRPTGFAPDQDAGALERARHDHREPARARGARRIAVRPHPRWHRAVPGGCP
jgi:transposase